MTLSNAFYFLHYYDEGDSFAYGKDERQRDLILDGSASTTNWDPPLLEATGRDLDDYLANDIGLRLCSPKLREVIDRCALGSDDLEWLEARVIFHNESHQFFALNPPVHPEVIDPIGTIYSGERFVVRPVISLEHAAGHNVFSFQEGSVRTIISEAVRHAIENAGCTGVDFAPVKTS